MTKLFKVTVLGAGGGIGQPLCLLLKTRSNLISDLNLYDVVDPTGVATDLSHIPTMCVVTAFGPDKLAEALSGANVVVIPAGVPRKPNMTRADLFNVNANIVKGLIEAVAINCPQAIVALITNPVNTLVPLAATILHKSNKGIDISKQLLGVTSLDILRTSTFRAKSLGLDPRELKDVCICGHSGNTIVPLIDGNGLSSEEIDSLCEQIRNAGTVVVEAKKGAGSATLSMAAAGYFMVDAILRGLSGVEGVVECAFVKSSITSASYFASPVVFGVGGVERVLALPELTEQQQKMLDVAMPILQSDIQKGLDFLN